MIENKAFSDIQYYRYCLRPKRETATLIQKIFKTFFFFFFDSRNSRVSRIFVNGYYAFKSDKIIDDQFLLVSTVQQKSVVKKKAVKYKKAGMRKVPGWP